MEAFLSIIIPVYRIQEIYLRECFDSLLHQDMDGFRVIVVDDGSPDGCGKICDEYAGKDRRFLVFHQENGGVSAARNLGLSAVETEWTAFIDADDWVEPDFVSTLYRAKETEEADIYLYDYVQEFAGKSRVRHLKDRSEYVTGEWLTAIRKAPFNHLVVEDRFYDYDVIVIWNKMYRTELIKENAMEFVRDAHKGQDAIFNSEILQYTDKYYYIHNALYHYRYIRESETNSFRKNIRQLNEIVFQNQERILNEFQLPDEYRMAHYARVATILYSYMRLYYFHPDNNMCDSDIKAELNQIISTEPYRFALQKASGSELTFTQKIFIYFVKKHSYRILRILVNTRLWIRNCTGQKLR